MQVRAGMSHTLSPRPAFSRAWRWGGAPSPRRVRDQGTPATHKCALIAVHVVAKPSFSTTKVDTRPPLLPMTPVPRSLLTTRPPTRATLWRLRTTETSRFAKTRSLRGYALRHRRDVSRTPRNAPELAPRERRLLAHAEPQMVQAVADPTTAAQRHARALLLR